MKHDFDCAWICAVLPQCRAGEPVGRRQDAVVLNAKEWEPKLWESQTTFTDDLSFPSLLWIFPSIASCGWNLERAIPMWNLPAHLQDKPSFVPGCPLLIGSFLSAHATSVGHQHCPEGVCRGEEVRTWRKMVCKRSRTWSLTWALLPARALPSCSISSGSRVALRAQQMISAGCLKSIKAILSAVWPARGFFSFAFAAWGRKHRRWMQNVATLCPVLEHRSFIRTDSQRNTISALSLFLTRADGAVFQVNFQLGYENKLLLESFCLEAATLYLPLFCNSLCYLLGLLS